MENKDMPAFPAIDQDWNEPSKQMIDIHYPGMSKREYVAALAGQGILAKSFNPAGHTQAEIERMAAAACMFADTILGHLKD